MEDKYIKSLEAQLEACQQKMSYLEQQRDFYKKHCKKEYRARFQDGVALHFFKLESVFEFFKDGIDTEVTSNFYLDCYYGFERRWQFLLQRSAQQSTIGGTFFTFQHVYLPTRTRCKTKMRKMMSFEDLPSVLIKIKAYLNRHKEVV